MRTLGFLGLALLLGTAFAQTLTRQQFVSVFTQREVGFTCERGRLSDGRERTLCQGGTALLEMIGNPRRLESASLLTFISTDDSSLALNLAYILGFAKAAFPTWDASDWMGTAIARALNGETVRGSLNGYLIEVSEMPAVTGAIMVSIKPQ